MGGIFGLYLFWGLLLAFTLYACGAENSSEVDMEQNATGTYCPRLVFPPQITTSLSAAKGIVGIDCVGANIHSFEFSFTGDNFFYGPFSFPCRDGHARITDIPPGVDIKVDVYAYDIDRTRLLHGDDIADIYPGEITQGKEIVLEYVDDVDTVEDVDPSEGVDPQGDEYTNRLNMTFVRIEPGDFMMGSLEDEPGHENEERLHRMEITRPFYLQITEVTQEQWEAVMGPNTNPSRFTSCGLNCPVDSVSWDDAQQFIETLNRSGAGTYRLPSEAEWEYAARARSETAYANGDITVDPELEDGTPEIDTNLIEIGWYLYNAESSTHEVGQLAQNDWGLYDMHGNVSEWCQDWYADYPENPEPDYSGPDNGVWKVIRGGAWYHRPSYCRSAHRGRDIPSYATEGFGFRLVCAQAEQQAHP